MKEKIFGALLAMTPLEGNAQEAKNVSPDKNLTKIELAQDSLTVNPELEAKTTAHWNVSLETNISLSNNSHHEQNSENIFEEEKKARELAALSAQVFDDCKSRNTLLKDVEVAYASGDLGSNAKIWQDYKDGKMSAAEAAKKFRYPLAPYINNLIKPGLILTDNTDSKEVLASKASSLLLSSYFSQAENFETVKYGNDDFARGLAFMDENLVSLKQEDLSAQSLINQIKEQSQNLSYETKIGALSFFTQALYQHYNNGTDVNTDKSDLDKMVANAAKYLSGEMDKPDESGVCRHYAALVSDLAVQGFGLEASVVSAARHELVQIKNDNGITLLDKGVITNSLLGQPILTKDDVDAAIIRYTKEPTITDLTIEAGGNKVLYENRYNNFAGLMNKLTNRDNLSLRAPEFIAGNDKLDLFPRVNEGGLTKGVIEKGNIGVQAYWLRNNNEYNDFLEGIKGINLAAYVPADFSVGQAKFKNIFFSNIGFYRSVLDLADNSGATTKTWDANMSLENYLKCSLNTSLTAGLISKLADFNLELAREGQQITGSKSFEYHGSLSPFINLEISDKDEGKAYLCTGAELTDYLALPNLKKISMIPWFQAGLEYDKQEIDFGVRARGEFQPASTRFNLDTFLQKDANRLELRAFLEMYNQEFKKLTPFQNLAGVELGVKRDLDNGYGMFLMLSVKSEGGATNQVLLNLGLNF